MSYRLMQTIMLLAAACCTAGRIDAAGETAVARAGRALMPVVVSEKASPRVQAAAADLAKYLGKISGARFQVTHGDGSQGLAVGTGAEFPALPAGKPFRLSGPFAREEYRLHSHGRGVYVIGATDIAVEHAVWDLLHRLGYRQYFPGRTWEIIPRAAELRISVDTAQRPAYHSRRIWYGHRTWDYNDVPYAQW